MDQRIVGAIIIGSISKQVEHRKPLDYALRNAEYRIIADQHDVRRIRRTTITLLPVRLSA